jgi:light-regulated signal transduction histidine kinase (bacteriophytochrome)
MNENNNELKIRNLELENKVKKLTGEIKESYKEITDFSHSISHDFRAPLRHIMEFTELLKIGIQEEIDEKSLRFIDIIKESSSKLNQYIDSLLEFSRTGNDELNIVHINLNELIKDVINSFSKQTAGRNINWKIKDLPEIKADHFLLKKAFNNLIDNSLKFTKFKDHPIIEIGYKQDTFDEFIFYISDNGAGFDNINSQKLFNLFQRLHKDQFEGAGIGLAVVRRIITKHGGKVWATGEENKGAQIYFTLPV